MKALLLVVLLAGCVTEADSSTEQGLHGDDSGWGEWCPNYPAVNKPHLWNECHNGVNGEVGICDVGVCRRQCTNQLGGCPQHFHAIPVAADGCECEPDLNGWDYGDVAPAAVADHEAPFTQNP